MFFEPKPEGSAVVRNGANCRRFTTAHNIAGKPFEPDYTPPLVEVLYAAHPTSLAEEYETFISRRGVMVLGISPASYGGIDGDDVEVWFMTVIYQEGVQLDRSGVPGIDGEDQQAPDAG